MLTMSSMLSFAGVIMTSSNERLEDITISSENDTAIIYIQDGVEKSIAIEQVSAILYDDGHFKEFSQNTFEETLNFGDDSAKIELQKLKNNPDAMKLLLSDPKFVNILQNIGLRGKAEYEIILSAEISKGTPKKQAKKIAQQAMDSIFTIEILEYIRRNPIGNK